MLDYQQVKRLLCARLDELNSQDGLKRTPAWVAQRIGKSTAAMTRWLKGERHMNADVRTQIASLLGMPASWLTRGGKE